MIPRLINDGRGCGSLCSKPSDKCCVFHSAVEFEAGLAGEGTVADLLAIVDPCGSGKPLLCFLSAGGNATDQGKRTDEVVENAGVKARLLSQGKAFTEQLYGPKDTIVPQDLHQRSFR